VATIRCAIVNHGASAADIDAFVDDLENLAGGLALSAPGAAPILRAARRRSGLGRPAFESGRSTRDQPPVAVGFGARGP
jgi:hypothetical protein